MVSVQNNIDTSETKTVREGRREGGKERERGEAVPYQSSCDGKSTVTDSAT